jgi:hypothetical protein
LKKNKKNKKNKKKKKKKNKKKKKKKKKKKRRVGSVVAPGEVLLLCGRILVRATREVKFALANGSRRIK